MTRVTDGPRGLISDNTITGHSQVGDTEICVQIVTKDVSKKPSHLWIQFWQARGAGIKEPYQKIFLVGFLDFYSLLSEECRNLHPVDSLENNEILHDIAANELILDIFSKQLSSVPNESIVSVSHGKIKICKAAERIFALPSVRQVTRNGSDAESETLRYELSKADKRLEDALASLAKINAELDSLKKEKEFLVLSKDEQDNQIQKIKKENEAALLNKDASESEVRRLKSEAIDLNEQVSAFKESQGAVARQALHLMTERTALQDKIKNIELRIQEEESKRKESDQRLAEAEDVHKKLSEKVTALDGQISAADISRAELESRLRDADSKVKELEEEVKKIKSKFDDEQAAALSREVSLRDQVSALHGEKSAAEAAANESNRTLAQRNDDFQALKAKSEEEQKKADVALREAQLSILEKQRVLDELNSEIERNRRAFAELNGAHDALVTESEKLRIELSGQIQSAHVEIAKLNENIRVAADESNSIRKALEAELQSLQSSHEMALSELDSLRVQETRRSNEFAELLLRQSRAKEEIAELNKNLAEQKEIFAKATQTSDSKIKLIEMQSAEKDAAHAASLTELSEEKNLLAAKLANSKTECQQQAESLDSLQKDLEGSKSEVLELSAKIEELTQRHEVEIQDRARDIVRLASEAERAELKRQEGEGLLAAAQQRVSHLEIDIKRSAEANNAERARSRAKIEAADAKVTELQESLRKTAETNYGLSCRITEILIERDAAHDELQRLKSELSESEKQRADIATQLELKERASEVLQRDLEAERISKRKHAEQLTDITTLHNALTQELAELEEEVEAATTKSIKEISALQEQILKEKAELHSAQVRAVDLSKTIEGLSTELMTSQNEISKLKGEFDVSSARCVRLSHENSDLLAQISEKESQIIKAKEVHEKSLVNLRDENQKALEVSAAEKKLLQDALDHKSLVYTMQEGELREARASNINLSHKVQALQGDFDHHKRENEELKKQIIEQQRQAELDLEAAKSRASAETIVAVQEQKRLQGALKASQDRHSALVNELGQVKEVNAKQAKRLTELKGQHEIAQSKQANADAKIRELEEALAAEVSARAKEVSVLSNALREAEEIKAKAETDCVAATLSLTTTKDSARKIEARLSQENENLNLQLEQVKERLKSLSDVGADKAKLVTKVAKLTLDITKESEKVRELEGQILSQKNDYESKISELNSTQRRAYSDFNEAKQTLLAQAAAEFAKREEMLKDELQTAQNEVNAIKFEHASTAKTLAAAKDEHTSQILNFGEIRIENVSLRAQIEKLTRSLDEASKTENDSRIKADAARAEAEELRNSLTLAEEKQRQQDEALTKIQAELRERDEALNNMKLQLESAQSAIKASASSRPAVVLGRDPRAAVNEVQVSVLEYAGRKLSLSYAPSKPQTVSVDFQFSSADDAPSISFTIDSEEHAWGFSENLSRVYKNKAEYFMHKYFAPVLDEPGILLGTEKTLPDVFTRILNKERVAVIEAHNLEYERTDTRTILALEKYLNRLESEGNEHAVEIMRYADPSENSSVANGELSTIISGVRPPSSTRRRFTSRTRNAPRRFERHN